MGESVGDILPRLKYNEIDKIDMQKCLCIDDTFKALSFKTTLRKVSKEEYILLFRHGYETANAVIASRLLDEFLYFDSKAYSWLKV